MAAPVRNETTIRNLVEFVRREHFAHQDSEYPLRMVEMLAKRLKTAKNMAFLEKACASGDKMSPCCVIKRKILRFGSNERCLEKPHVPFIRLFRYPWIKTHHAVKGVDTCMYPYRKRHVAVCCNPYHYEVAQAPTPDVPPVFINRMINYHEISDVKPDLRLNLDEIVDMVPNASFEGAEMTFNSAMSEESSPTSTLYTTHSPTDTQPSQSPDLVFSQPSSEMISDSISPQSYLSEDLDYDKDTKYMDMDDDMNGDHNHRSLDTIPKSIMNMLMDPRQSLLTDVVEYMDADYWATMTYYERTTRVTEPFNIGCKYFLIDGYAQPNEHDRICLGYTRSHDTTVKSARKRIGKGVRFYYVSGEIFAECVSDVCMFVQSPTTNQRHGWHLSTVCKVPSGGNLKIFDNAEFGRLLSETVSKGYEAVYALTKLCTIRISFVKGWGVEYHRQTVGNTPCWLEVNLNGPLLWIDRVLASMGAPPQKCTSRT